MKNYYDLLGLAQTATPADIKQAYRRLSVKFHPDKNAGDSYFAELFKQINEAQETLLDVTKRAMYDAKLNGFAQQQAQVTAAQAKLRREREELARKQHEQLLAAQRLREQEAALQQRAAAAKPPVASAVPKPSPPPGQKKEPLWQIARRWRRYKIAGYVLNLALIAFLFGGPKKLHFFRPKGTDAYVTAEKGLFLREKPQSTSKALASLPLYTYLTVISTDGPTEVLGFQKAAWYQVKCDSVQGWVWSGHVARIK